MQFNPEMRKIRTQIQDLSSTLKDLPFFDFKISISEIDKVVGKAVQDLIANMDERSELKSLTKQIKIEIQEIDTKKYETEIKRQELMTKAARMYNQRSPSGLGGKKGSYHPLKNKYDFYSSKGRSNSKYGKNGATYMPQEIEEKLSEIKQYLIALEGRKNSRLQTLKKFEQVQAKNTEQRGIISTFLINICKQAKRKELDEKVSSF